MRSAASGGTDSSSHGLVGPTLAVCLVDRDIATSVGNKVAARIGISIPRFAVIAVRSRAAGLRLQAECR